MSDQINVNALADTLNQKVDIPDGVNQSDVDYVVEKYQNGSNWYRVYKSGWVEQGGIVDAGSGTSGTISLLKQMVNTNYVYQASVSNDAANNFFILNYNSRTTSTINWLKSAASIPGCWEVKGMGA